MRVRAKGLLLGFLKGVGLGGRLVEGGIAHCWEGVAALVAAAAGRVMSARAVAESWAESAPAHESWGIWFCMHGRPAFCMHLCEEETWLVVR